MCETYTELSVEELLLSCSRLSGVRHSDTAEHADSIMAIPMLALCAGKQQTAPFL